MATIAEKDQEILTWLQSPNKSAVAPPPSMDRDTEILNWLEKKDEQSEVARSPELEKHVDQEEVGRFTQYTAGMTDTILDTIDIPNHLYNWASEKLGSDSRVPTVGDMAANVGMGYKEGEEPDTASYKAGQYTAMGLEFMVPFIKLAKAPSIVAPANAVRTAATGVAETNPGITKGVAQKMNEMYVNTPKRAFATDIIAGGTSGAASHFGEREYGTTGGQIAGLAGGLIPAVAISNAARITDYTLASFAPFTKAGGMARAKGIMNAVKQSPDLSAKIKMEENASLKGTVHTSGQLAGDDYISAL